ncbi:MAG: YitT family protein [Deltaproteobacteria bacterium]|nr:YitT family protein [Deltaproteobacteria bacterium]
MVVIASKKTLPQLVYSSFWMLLGAFVAAFSLEVFLIPNNIIDGGVIGIAILLSSYIGQAYIYPLVILLNLPFIYLAFRSISKVMVVQMMIALAAFALIGSWIGHSDLPFFQPYRGDLLEIVVIGGLILGFGVGLIIRSGGCLDGTEILGLLVNQKYGISVGNVVLLTNTIIFSIAGFVYGDWHPPIQSLITFFVVIKIMDMVIMGIDEMKSVMIFSSRPGDIADSLMHHMGLGLTFIQGRGGFTGEKKEVLFLMAERLQLSEIKHTVHAIDPEAFIAIENLHEVATNNLKGIARKQHG